MTENNLHKIVEQILKDKAAKPAPRKIPRKEKIITRVLVVAAIIIIGGIAYATFPGHVDKVKAAIFSLSLMLYLAILVCFGMKEVAAYFDNIVAIEIGILQREIIKSSYLLNFLKSYDIADLLLIKLELSVRIKGMRNGILYSLVGKKFAELGGVAQILTIGLAFYLQHTIGFLIFLISTFIIIITFAVVSMETAAISLENVQEIIDLSLKQRESAVKPCPIC